MINMNIFAVLLNCAYDLDILYFEKTKTHKSYSSGKQIIEQACYILTSDGLVEISVKEEVFLLEDEPKISFSSKFKSALRNVDVHLVQDLIYTQLQTEAFLHIDDYQNVSCFCEAIE